jgi:tRNA threonylcarbamoyladenosine biosynthesis protein TsaE
MKTLLADETATLEAGRHLASTLQAGDCIALIGGLGAGKTHFTKGIVAGLGGSAEVTSPTFTLVHEYRGGRLPVFHFDFYRIDSAAEILAVGWDDYLDEGGVIVAEWADKFSDLLPEQTTWWKLDLAPGGGRTLEKR